MKKQIVGVFSVVVVFLAVGCGKASSQAVGLSADRLAAMKEVKNGIGEVSELQRAGLQANQQRSRLRGEVDQAVASGRCQRNASQTAVEITGPNCPVSFRARTTLNGQTHASHIEIQYQLNSSTAEVDVTQLTMTTDSSQSESGAKVTFGFSGTSRKHGAFSFSGAIDMSVNAADHQIVQTASVAIMVGGATTNFTVTMDNDGFHAKTSDGVTLSDADAAALFGNG